MKFRGQTYFKYLFAVLLLDCLCNSAGLLAQITDQTVQFNTPKVNLVYQLPIRSGLNSSNPVEIELPQLNLTVNLFENYMQYLLKLQKVATGTSLKIVYAPEQSLESWNKDESIINLSDTGLNQTLTKVNKFLAKKSGTDKNYLLDSADTLFNIPDQFSRIECGIAENLQLANISTAIDSLEPDCEVAINSEKLIFSTRPYKNNNRIFIYSEKNDVCSASMLLGPGLGWYANLRPSADEKFLAYTENFEPYVLNLADKKSHKLFPDKSMRMLSMEWSPVFSWLAGMVLDLESQQRTFFVFDTQQNKLLSIKNVEKLGQNFLYAWPYWAKNGKKIIMTSGRHINLVDVENSIAYPKVTSLPNEIVELVWSENSKSFAVVEVIGQTRSTTVFDDFDLRKSILHRFDLSDDFKAYEDHAQAVDSRNTIKIVGFWTLDRVLYLEGHLKSQRLNVPMWDLSKQFSAYLTPPPSEPRSRSDELPAKKEEPSRLPMKYLYVFKSLDGKFKNVYDPGFVHTNHLYVSEQSTLWFVGLRKPEEISLSACFNLRGAPYPFIERNKVIFSEMPASKMHNFVKFLQDYNLRFARFTPNNQRLVFLANFCGPLNVWTGNFRTIIEGLANK
jgi:dipeptidyl aminopeptidase/acylaminoacyl peptidase